MGLDWMARTTRFLPLVLALGTIGLWDRDLRAQDAPQDRSFREIQHDIRVVLREEAESRTLAERSRAIYELCALHREIVRDSRFASSEPFQELRRQVASRLVKVQAELKQRAFRERAEGRNAGRVGDRGSGRGRRDASPPLLAPSPSTPADGPSVMEVADSLADSLALAGAVQGGGTRLLAEQGWGRRGAGGGAMVNGDYGQDLVDLIQKTIHPDFWDINGGPGAIVYFSPLRCLVVRATDEVHRDVGGLVRGVRNANP